MSEYSWIITAVVGFAFVGLLVRDMFRHHNAWKSRQRLFEQRDDADLGETFGSKFDGFERVSRQFVIDELGVIAHCVGVAPEKLRPDDRFDTELALTFESWSLYSYISNQPEKYPEAETLEEYIMTLWERTSVKKRTGSRRRTFRLPMDYS